MTAQITAVILTLNEEKNLGNALRSVASWVDEIVIVDMYSEDRTVEIARSYNARVFQHPRVGFQDPARPFAMEQASGDWIINLDADEIVPRKLAIHLRQIAKDNVADVCAIPRLNYFSGAPLMHSGWAPEGDRQLRFFRKGYLEFSPKIHALPQPAPNARVLALDLVSGDRLIHLNFLDAEHYLHKFNRYTTIEAEQSRSSGVISNARLFLWPPVKEFLYRYLWKQGFRDGWRGLYYCAMMGAYRLTIAAKLRELEEGYSGQECLERYSEIADEFLREYEQDL